MRASKFVVQFSSEDDEPNQLNLANSNFNFFKQEINQNPQKNQTLNNKTSNHIKKNFQNFRTKPKLNIKDSKLSANQGSIKANIIVGNPKINHQIYQSQALIYNNSKSHDQENIKNLQSSIKNHEYLSKTDSNKFQYEKQPNIIKESHTRRNRIHKLKLDPLAQLHKTQAVKLNFFDRQVNKTNQNKTKKSIQMNNFQNQKVSLNLNDIKNQSKLKQKQDQLVFTCQSAQKLGHMKKQKIFYFDQSEDSDPQHNKIQFKQSKIKILQEFNQKEYKNVKTRRQNTIENQNKSKEQNQPKAKINSQNNKDIKKQLEKNNKLLYQSQKKMKRKHLDLGDISQLKEKFVDNQLQINQNNRIEQQNINNVSKNISKNISSTPKNKKNQYEQLSLDSLQDLKLFLMRPLKNNSILKLIFKRDQSVLKWFSPQFNLYIQNSLSFLFAAKKVSSKPTSKFLLSTYKEVFDSNFPSYIGKMKSNIFGQTLNIFGPGFNPQQAKQNFAQPRQLLATIVYETSLFSSTNRPRSFKVFVKNHQSNYYKVFPEVQAYGQQISLNTLYQKRESNRNHIKVYKTREPKYCQKQMSYTLDFYGRVKVSSIKNFILEEVGRQNDIPSLLFGKVSDDVFHLDIYEGMSPNVGFCVALSCFDSRVGQ